MIASFFQNLSTRGVEQLLISGQAAVLYGAATFSEDIDLWINPTLENCQRFILALRDSGALYYKLTPHLTVENLAKGHGFHFILGGVESIFLDVMGRPPRVGAYALAASRKRWMDSEWGRLALVSLKDLVELKKTQRVEDYPIISNLALAWFDQPECAATEGDLQWALDNLFTIASLQSLFQSHPQAVAMVSGNHADDLRAFGGEILAGRQPAEQLENHLSDWIQERIARLQRADRHYWRAIIAELKTLRASGQLTAEGTPV